MEDEIGNPPSIVGNTMPSAPYSHRAPSPPFIHIPSTGHCGNIITPNLVPSFEHIDPAQLTAEDVLIITRNMKQTATDRTFDWSYEKRREAQELTDFLYLGPNSVARDHDWLRSTGITMILVARDVRMGNTKLNSVEKAAAVLGITLQYVNIGSYAELLSTFSHVVRSINKHLLSIYHRQVQEITNGGSTTVDSSNFTRGKVLFTCETGNDRSAVLAAAYIMAVFGKDMVTVLQFIGISRFCCTFDEDMKRKLQSWEDLTRARAQVASIPQSVSQPKRQIEEYFHDDESDLNDVSMDVDRDRFEGRGTFAPFVDM